MKSLLRMGLSVMVLALALTLSNSTAVAQVDCIDACLAQLDGCINGQPGPVNCEDQYSQCVEDCLAILL